MRKLLLSVLVAAVTLCAQVPQIPSSAELLNTRTGINTGLVYLDANKLQYQGTYAGGTTYPLSAVVLSGGIPYVSIQAINAGNTPASSPSWWTPLVTGLQSAITNYSTIAGLAGYPATFPPTNSGNWAGTWQGNAPSAFQSAISGAPGTWPSFGTLALLNNPMTTAGDFIVGGSSGALARLANPGNGTFCPSWSAGVFSSWITCPGAGGGISSIGLTMPSWLAVSNSPMTVNGTIGVAAATAQTSHQVIGTCGSATTFGPCALVAADIPALSYQAPITGAPGTWPTTFAPINTGNWAGTWQTFAPAAFCFVAGCTFTGTVQGSGWSVTPAGAAAFLSTSTGASPPPVAWFTGTAGLYALANGTITGTVPTGASFISSNGGVPTWLTNSVNLPMMQGPSSAPTTGDAVCFSGTTGSLAVDCGFVPLTNLLASAKIWLGNGSGAAAAVTPSGDWTMTNAGVATNSKINGVAYGASPATNTVPVVTGPNTVTYEALPHAAIAATAVTPGSYTGANITVAADGSITAASNGTGGTGMAASTYDPAAIAQQVVGTTAPQIISNKTLTAPVINSGAVFNQDTSASPAGPIVTAGTGGVTAGMLVSIDASGPSKYITVSGSGGCGEGVALTTALASATFQLGSVSGLVYSATADNAVTAGHYLVGGTSTPGYVRDSGQTATSAIDIGTCIVGRALQSVSGGAAVLFKYFGKGINGTGIAAADVAAGALANGMTATTQSAGDSSTNLATTHYVDTALFYGTCDIPINDTSGSAITSGQMGPQSRVCFIPKAATIVEMDVNADAGTPSIIVGRNHAGTIVNIVSGALATAASGGIACSNTGGTTGLNGATTCSGTLQNTSLSAGDYLELVSGTPGGTAKLFVVHVTYTMAIN